VHDQQLDEDHVIVEVSMAHDGTLPRKEIFYLRELTLPDRKRYEALLLSPPV